MEFSGLGCKLSQQMDIRRVFLNCLISFLLTASTVLAQGSDTAQPPTEKQPEGLLTASSFREFLRDERDLWTSLLKRETYSSHTIKKYGIPFTLLSAALISTDNKTAEFLPNTEDQKKWSARVSKSGATSTLLAASGGTYLIGKITGNRHVQETGLLALHALGHSQVVPGVVKQLTNRLRPIGLNGSAGFWNGGDSFPSGHASTTFAVATVFAYEYRERPLVPIVAYTVASSVAASRVAAQRHWLSDIVVGGSMGFLVGRYVYKRHHDPSLPGSIVPPRKRFVPNVTVSGATAALNWQF